MSSFLGTERRTLRAGASGTRDRLVARVARMAGWLSRVTRMGAGATVPGRIVHRLDPGFIRRRAAALPDGIVVVSGTNGKTTTASMVQSVLRSQGISFIANPTGSNLLGGVANALVEATPGTRMGVFEVDEAALPRLVPLLKPRLLILTNVFRDQLDRFGEPERVAALLRLACERLPEGATVVANADDIQLWSAVQACDPIGFGVSGISVSSDSGTEAEPVGCPSCGAELEFTHRTLANLGQARCERCGWRSVRPRHRARVVATAGLEGIVFEIADEIVTLPVGGVHSAYNAAAAITAVEVLGIPAGAAIGALEEYQPRFGRAEEIRFEDHTLWLGLIKNPAGATVLTQQVAADRRVGAVVLSVNDNDADGQDISWIWDADFEALVEGGMPLVPGGRRADDVAVRLRYAGGQPLPAQRDPLTALRAALDAAPDHDLIVVLATYTAMLDIREALFDRSTRVQDAATA